MITSSIIKKYFLGTDAHSDWKAGSPVTFTGEWQGKAYRDKGIILENDPGKKLRYNYWSSMSGIEDNPENYVNITYELKTQGDNTVLTVSRDNIPSQQMKEHSAERQFFTILRTFWKSRVNKKNQGLALIASGPEVGIIRGLSEGNNILCLVS